MQVLSNKKSLTIIAIVSILFLPLFLNKGNVFLLNPLLDKYLFKVGYPIGFIIPITLLFWRKFRDHLFSQINSLALRIFFIPMFFFLTPAILPYYIHLSAETIADMVSSNKYEEIVTIKNIDTHEINGGRTMKSCNLSLSIYDISRNNGTICILPRFYGEPLSKSNNTFKKGDKIRISGRQSFFGAAIDGLEVIHK